MHQKRLQRVRRGHGVHRDKRKSRAEQRREEKRREDWTFDCKNPPFPPEAGEGWGTLKFSRGGALVDKPKRKRDSSHKKHSMENRTSLRSE
jgi:hypothetical protein